MASTAVETGISLLDDPKHLKSFFSKAKAAPIKSYRRGTAAISEVAASEVAPEETYTQEDTNGVASPVQSAADEVGGADHQIGEIHGTETDELAHAGDFEGADWMRSSHSDMEEGHINATTTAVWPSHNTDETHVNVPATADVRLSKTETSTQDEATFASYGLGKAPFTTLPTTSTNGSTLDTDFVNGCTQGSPANVPSPKTSPEGDALKPVDSATTVADIDSPAHKKNFFKSVRSHGNALGNRYSPRTAHEHGEASQEVEDGHGTEHGREEAATTVDISAPKNTMHKQIKSPYETVQGTEESSTMRFGHHESILHPGNGVPSNKFFESPRASGVVAPPPTPETPARMDRVIHVPATIDEQPSSPTDLNNSHFTLSQSIHAPPHLRSSSKVQKKPAPVENYGLFERQSFKAVEDVTSNGVIPTETNVGVPNTNNSEDSGATKPLPPHLRSRPANVGGLRTTTNTDKLAIKSAPIESTPIATKFHGDDPKILGMRHAKACPFIDIQRLMDLGIYAHEPNELKENIPPKTNIVPAVAEKPLEKPTTYQPPHKRANNNVPDASTSIKNTENTTMANPYASNSNTNGIAYTNDSAKAVLGKDDLILGTTWAKPLPRESGPARHRKVILKGLPEYSTSAFAASLVWGGPIEEIVVTGSGTHAYVTFMHAEDCAAYYKTTSNDVKYIASGQPCYVTVTQDTDVNPPSGGLKTAIEKEFTRSVRLIGVEESFSLADLWALAANKGRKVESVENGKTARGARQVIVNFCNVYDAIKFRSDLNRDEDWEHVNVSYQADTCADATGVRILSPGPNFLTKRPVASAF